MSLYEFGPFRLDAARLLLLDGDEPIPLGPKVVETLLALIEHPGEIVPKGDLLARVWPEGYVDEANLAQNIYVLRKTLRARWNPAAIETIPRRGYRFTAPVQVRDVPRAEPIPSNDDWRSWLPRRGAVVAALLSIAILGGSALTLAVPSGSRSANLASEDTRLYTMGRYYWNLRTPDGIAKSVEYFSRVVANDPRDARGYAGLASANAIQADYGYGSSPPKVYVARARAYAQTALRLDPSSSEAYAVLGLISSESIKGVAPRVDWAFKDLRRAIELDPQSGSAHEWFGMALLREGHLTQAYSELRKASELEPISVATTAWLGTTAYLQRRYRDAVAFARETIDLSPQRDDAYITLGLSYEALGDRAQAEATFHRLARACPECQSESAALLAALYAHTKQMARARAQLTIAQAHVKDVAPQDLAVALAAVGERGAALTWLQRWRSDSYYAATELANDPRFAALRQSVASRTQKPA